MRFKPVRMTIYLLFWCCAELRVQFSVCGDQRYSEKAFVLCSHLSLDR